MSRISKLIDDLENLQQEDIKNSAKVFAITATLSARLQAILQELEERTDFPSQASITKTEITARYGNYQKAYAAYQKAYGIKCKTGWDNLLKAIQGLPPPITLEQRVEKLEQIVRTLVETLLDNQPF